MTKTVPALLFLAFPALAAEPGTESGKAASLRVAVVDMTRVFESHPATEGATTRLTRAREAQREDFKKRSNALKEVLQRHQELIRAGKKSEAAEELKKANEIEKSIATLRTTGLRDLEERFRKAKRIILESIRRSVERFNGDGRYALVFDSSSASSNGLPQVVHAPGAEDITDEVIAFIAREHEEEREKAKSGE